MLREQKIIDIQYKLTCNYVYLMSIILLGYTGIFYFYMKDIFLVCYLLFGIISLITSWTIVRNKISIDKIIKWYFIIAPLFNIYIILQFAQTSVASYVWMVPLPYGAYIFFGRREVISYSLYALFLILIGLVLANTINFNFIRHSPSKIRVTDTLLFIANIIIVCFLSFYKDKIRELKLLTKIEEKEKIILPVVLDIKDLENAESIFEKIETEMQINLLFKNQDFNISTLSTILKVSNNYISKSIRIKGYANFNSYVNTYRINHVKKVMLNTDFEKLTLAYVYSEAGFTSQATFNRVFKQIEGNTPSEYLLKIKDGSISCQEQPNSLVLK